MEYKNTLYDNAQPQGLGFRLNPCSNGIQKYADKESIVDASFVS